MGCNASAASARGPAPSRPIARVGQAVQVARRSVHVLRSSAAARSSSARCATRVCLTDLDCSKLAADPRLRVRLLSRARPPNRAARVDLRAGQPSSGGHVDLGRRADRAEHLCAAARASGDDGGQPGGRATLPKSSGGREFSARDRPAEHRQRIHERARRWAGARDRHGRRRDRRLDGPMRGHAERGLSRGARRGQRGRAAVSEVRPRRRGARGLLLLWRPRSAIRR